MKKEHLILVIFLAVICLSGLAIYIYMNSHASSAEIQSGVTISDSNMTMQMPPSENSPGEMNFNDNKSQGPDPKVLQLQIEQLESQIKTDPNNFDALVNLGNNYFDLNNPPKAIENYEKALKIHPNEAPVLVDCGSMYRQEGNPDKAIDYFNRAIKINPQLPQAYLNLGMVMAIERQNPNGAVVYWKKYLELDPNSEMKDFITQEINKAEGK